MWSNKWQKLNNNNNKNKIKIKSFLTVYLLFKIYFHRF